MEGQWIGQAEGDTPGTIVLDIDDDFSRYRGSVRLFPSSSEPGPIFDFVTSDRSDEQTFQDAILHWMPPGQARFVTFTQISADFPEMRFPQTANIRFYREASNIKAAWKSNIGTEGKATLIKADASLPSGIIADSSIKSWDEFKNEAVKHAQRRLIFRGQSNPWRLRTTFHRSKRKDLIRYIIKDVPTVHREITARTRHLFDLNDNYQFGAFLNLIQHHGYPTPLLDWSYSPFVAAFFAYRFSDKQQRLSQFVRIYTFDKHEWEVTYPQYQFINFIPPHFSAIEPLAVENPRAMPQQAISTLTNVDDIESYILQQEKSTGKRFLSAIDLPIDDRDKALYELNYMGITAGSLFPGLDGACEELTSRMFKRQSL